MTRSKQPTHLQVPSRLARPALAALLVAAAGASHACTAVHPGASTTIAIETWDDADGGGVPSGWRHDGNANFLTGCLGDVPINVSAAMSGLEFVQNVVLEGETFPAFGVIGSPRTPLLVFQFMVANGSGTTLRFPFDVRTTLRYRGDGIVGSNRWAWVRMATVSRGGTPEPLPLTALGDITYVSPDFPSMVKTDDYSVRVTLKPKTCTLTSTDVLLKDVGLADLPSVGSTAHETSFSVGMTCNGAFPAFLTLTDPNAAGATGSRLAPTANATAGAVQVELLREGRPVELGQRWALASTQNGAQDVALAARYYRTAGAVHGGLVEGQATLTVTYR